MRLGRVECVLGAVTPGPANKLSKVCLTAHAPVEWERVCTAYLQAIEQATVLSPQLLQPALIKGHSQVTDERSSHDIM